MDPDNYEECICCDGSGDHPDEPGEPCPDCDGEGVIWFDEDDA